MEVTRPFAIGLCGLTLFGVEAATWRDVAVGSHKETDVSPHAGAAGGTVVYPAESGDFITMDARSPVRVYGGCAITASEAAAKAAYRPANVTGL